MSIAKLPMVLSLPEYHQGHALIESHIQIIKNCMERCASNGYNDNLALLTLCFTCRVAKPSRIVTEKAIQSDTHFRSFRFSVALF